MKKPSPYQIFNEWLFNPVPYAPFPEECLRAINKRAILASLGKLDGVTIYLDKYFNKYDLMAANDLEFYMFVKEYIIKKFRVKKWDLSFFKTEKKQKNLKELQKSFPYLKLNEIEFFMELVKDDEEADGLYESLGLSKPKKKKMNKSEKKEFNERRKAEVAKIAEELGVPDSFDKLLQQFNVKLNIDSDGIYCQEGTHD